MMHGQTQITFSLIPNIADQIWLRFSFRSLRWEDSETPSPLSSPKRYTKYNFAWDMPLIM